MTVNKITDTQKPEGPFVLMTFDGEGFLFDERHQVVIINGKPKQRDVKRNYFESDLGEGKAKYWTLDINEAHKFDTIDEATTQLCKLNRPHLIKVRKLSQETQDLRARVHQEHAEWAQSTFGDIGPIGPLKHLSKEALEAAEMPGDLLEWADMQFLLWDAQRRAGISDDQITGAMVEKLAINKQRAWPEPKDGEPRFHIAETPEKETGHGE